MKKNDPESWWGWGNYSTLKNDPGSLFFLTKKIKFNSYKLLKGDCRDLEKIKQHCFHFNLYILLYYGKPSYQYCTLLGYTLGMSRHFFL